MQDIGRGLRGCRTETPSTLNGSFSRSALSAQPCQIFAAAAWNRGSSGDFAARIGAVLRARELVEKNHYHQSSIGTAFASAQHLPIIFVLDNAVRREARLIPVRDRRLFWRDGDSHQGLQERRLGSDFVRLAGRRPQVRSVSVGVRVERRVLPREMQRP
jgi:hypothetical protein